MTKFNVSTPQGLGELDKHFQDRSYVDGWTPSQADVEVYDALKTPPDAKSVNVTRWWTHVGSFSDSERQTWRTASAAAAELKKEEPKKEEAKQEDDVDLFGSDDDDEHEKEIERRAKEAEEKKKAAGKKAVVLKSAVVIDVKPWEDTTPLDKLEELVRGITMDGLEWKASKLVEIGYGIKKLVISCHIEDDKVSVDDIQDQIQAFEDYVQSTDIASFTKL